MDKPRAANKKSKKNYFYNSQFFIPLKMVLYIHLEKMLSNLNFFRIIQ